MTPFWGGEVCYEPDPLPPGWEFPSDLWPLLNEANRQLMLLEGVGRSLPSPAILLGPMRDREAILSSRIEGTIATPRELLLYELDPKEVQSEADPRNQHREVANYARALEHAVESPLPTGLPLIRQLHHQLMDGVRGDDKQPGAFRKVPVAIGNRFIPPSPERLQDFLEPFDRYLAPENSKYEPLVDCFLTHYQFETIHPFADGNGRVGRLLLTLMIKERCGLTQPWLHISEYFERDKGRYCDLLYRISSEAAWSEWIAYCLEGVAELAAKTVERCDRLRRLREEHYRRLADTKGSVRLHQIVEDLFRTPIISVVELRRRLNVSRPTADADALKLENVGIIRQLEGHSPKTYYEGLE